MTTTKSLLSKKDREKLHPSAQIQKLRRIAVRAQKNADWLTEMLGDYYVSYPEGAEETRIKRDKSQAKATAAADEMVALAKANGDPRARGL